jgi:transposase InsO family protein
MQNHLNQFPQETVVKILGVSRSGFHAWKKQINSERKTKERQLVQAIQTIHRSSREIYGSPRVFRELRKQGVAVSRSRVERLMRREQIRGKARRKFKVTTQSDHRFPIAPNIIQGNFKPAKPNQVWAADITYIWTQQGWLFLAVVIDLFSRKVVGWSMNDSVNTDLTLNALRMAYATRNPGPGLIHHSDRGCQYASSAYQLFLQSQKAVCSMSRTGNCWDNAVVESFFHSLKTEAIYSERFDRRSEARAKIFDWIEIFYNRQRLHSTLGYMAPAQYEAKSIA